MAGQLQAGARLGVERRAGGAVAQQNDGVGRGHACQRLLHVRQGLGVGGRHPVGDAGQHQALAIRRQRHVVVQQQAQAQVLECRQPALVFRVVLVVAGNRIDAVAGA
ncbi:hypothetical protein G6F65_022654 [Rhizopus arrhizus]|nr:hypothetical protein G6F65_022654 [Rhizopus arrhizus]